MKNSVLKIGLLAMVSSSAFAACATNHPSCGDHGHACAEGKCACGKDCEHKKEDGKSCDHKEDGADKKACSHHKE